MIIKPRVRGFICVTTHPTGCDANVKQQIDYVKAKRPIANGPKKVLVIGASTGYGLAARITAAFGCGAATLGVFFERAGQRNQARHAPAGTTPPPSTSTPQQAGLYAKSINGDAFSDEVKQQVIELIKRDLGQVDLVVYSLAAPRRTHPEDRRGHQLHAQADRRAVNLRGLDTDKEVITETVHRTGHAGRNRPTPSR